MIFKGDVYYANLNLMIRIEQDGVRLPYYRYEVILTNVNSDFNEIEDTFDTNLLEPYDPRGWFDWRVTTENNDVRIEPKVSYENTDSGR